MADKSALKYACCMRGFPETLKLLPLRNGWRFPREDFCWFSFFKSNALKKIDLSLHGNILHFYHFFSLCILWIGQL